MLRYESRFERWRPQLRPAPGARPRARRRAAACCSISAPPRRPGAPAVRARDPRLRRDRRTAAGRPVTTTRSWRSATAPAATATSGCRRSPPHRDRACACSERAPRSSSRASTVRRTRCGRACARTPGPWGVEPESRWGRLVGVRRASRYRASRAPGRFYAEFERALREGGPPPVDPADAVATLEVIETPHAAARSRNMSFEPVAGRRPIDCPAVTSSAVASSGEANSRASPIWATAASSNS